jgi:hypothetical protein
MLFFHKLLSINMLYKTRIVNNCFITWWNACENAVKSMGYTCEIDVGFNTSFVA